MKYIAVLDSENEFTEGVINDLKNTGFLGDNPRYAFGMESIKKQECKQGKWIRYEKEFTESDTYRQIKMPVIECSICQEKIAGHIGIMNYCPNCGAEMVGAENE